MSEITSIEPGISVVVPVYNEEATVASLLDAVRAVVRGQHFVSADVAKKLTLTNLRNQGEASPIRKLTAREMQVMMMVIRGHANREISDALFLSPKTVYTYRARVLDKLNLANDVELTHFGIRHGLIDPRA